VVPGPGVLWPHTLLHTTLLVVGRAVVLAGGGGSFRPPCHSGPLTLYSSSFNISFNLPRKRHCGTEAKETSRRHFSLRFYNKLFFFVHIFRSCEGVETFPPGFTTEVRVKNWVGVPY
jgi:hypothetical protein